MGKDIDKVDVLVNWGGKACSGETLTDGEWTGVCKINFNSIYFTRVRASQVAQVVKNPLTNAGAARNVGQEDHLEKEMAAHSSILAWESL